MAKRRIPNAPNKTIWLIALISGGLGILSHFYYIKEVSPYSFWMLLVGFGLLVIGTSSRNI